MTSRSVRKPDWGCENYKQKGHTWIDCEVCVSGLREAISNTKDDLDNCRKKSIDLMEELGKMMLYKRFFDYKKGNTNGKQG